MGYTPDSNVYKTYNAIKLHDAFDLHGSPITQITFYDDGIGTQKNKYLKKQKDEDKSHGIIPIKFLGVWDTVSSLGFPQKWDITSFGMFVLNAFFMFLDRLSDRWIFRHRFYNYELTDNVEYAWQALAIDLITVAVVQHPEYFCGALLALIIFAFLRYIFRSRTVEASERLRGQILESLKKPEPAQNNETKA